MIFLNITHINIFCFWSNKSNRLKEKISTSLFKGHYLYHSPFSIMTTASFEMTVRSYCRKINRRYCYVSQTRKKND